MVTMWVWKIVGKALDENDLNFTELAHKMGRSREKASAIMRDAMFKAELFTELMDELGYDVLVRRRSDGEETNIEVVKKYRRVRRK